MGDRGRRAEQPNPACPDCRLPTAAGYFLPLPVLPAGGLDPPFPFGPLLPLSGMMKCLLSAAGQQSGAELAGGVHYHPPHFAAGPCRYLTS